MPERKRDYKKEYREYHSKPEQIENRAQRNAARREYAEANPGASMAGKDVHHKRPVRSGGSNSKSNLALTSTKHRGWNRGR